MKRVALVLLLLAFAMPAMADSIDFSFLGASWSWAGSPNPLTASAPLVFALASTGSGGIEGPGSLTTGAYSGGTFEFGPGGSISISGPDCSGACFTGTFVSAQFVQNSGSGNISFSANVVSGTVDAAFLAFLGLSGDPTTWAGSITGTLPGSVNIDGGHNPEGQLGSFDMVLHPVAEPGSLAMLGSGLIGLAGLLRKKLSI